MGVLEVPWNPSRRQLRQFGWLLAGAALLLAGLVYQRGHGGLPAALLLAAGLIFGTLGTFRPPALRWVFVGWMVAVFPVGWLVSHIALALMYYLVLTPIGLLLRLCGHDPMQRRGQEGRATYWRPRSDPDDVERYFKQY